MLLLYVHILFMLNRYKYQVEKLDVLHLKVPFQDDLSVIHSVTFHPTGNIHPSDLKMFPGMLCVAFGGIP